MGEMKFFINNLALISTHLPLPMRLCFHWVYMWFGCAPGTHKLHQGNLMVSVETSESPCTLSTFQTFRYTSIHHNSSLGKVFTRGVNARKCERVRKCGRTLRKSSQKNLARVLFYTDFFSLRAHCANRAFFARARSPLWFSLSFVQQQKLTISVQSV